MIFNADDFGLTFNGDKKMLHLLDLKIINAISVFVGQSSFSQDLAKKDVKVGLHLNLSNLINEKGLFLSLIGMRVGNIQERLRTEVRLQIEKFKFEFGYFPKHIDGHEHYHQAPFISRVVLSEILKFRNEFPQEFYVRNSDPGLSVMIKSFWFLGIRTGFKNLFFLLLGKCYKMSLKYNNVKTNNYFWGCYSFGRKKYDEVLIFYLRQPKDNFSVFCCHPGVTVSEFNESTPRREEEFNALNMLGEQK